MYKHHISIRQNKLLKIFFLNEESHFIHVKKYDFFNLPTEDRYSTPHGLNIKYKLKSIFNGTFIYCARSRMLGEHAQLLSVVLFFTLTTFDKTERAASQYPHAQNSKCLGCLCALKVDDFFENFYVFSAL